MTFGVQNTEAEAHAILDEFFARGHNMLDTAEVYPVPSSDPSWVPGHSEEIIGSYLAARPGLRDRVLIATKVAGYMPASDSVGNRVVPRDPAPAPARLDRASVLAACDASLRRLGTDRIDLLQLHWPDRYVALFGGRAYDPAKERPGSVPIEETLGALAELLAAGKIRAYGLSNETTYGVCRWCTAADAAGVARPATIQNNFSLLNRSFEGHMAEACAPSNYNVGLIPWSVLCGGILSHKYGAGGPGGDVQAKERPDLAGARFNRWPSFQSRFYMPRALAAADKYAAIALDAGISPASLALGFCRSRWFIPSTIIGASSIKQVRENLDVFEEGFKLSAETLAKIDAVHAEAMDITETVF
jgi:aryl-alcohol dehydrogenase-like predicted oxidoreductase